MDEQQNKPQLPPVSPVPPIPSVVPADKDDDRPLTSFLQAQTKVRQETASPTPPEPHHRHHDDLATEDHPPAPPHEGPHDGPEEEKPEAPHLKPDHELELPPDANRTAVALKALRQIEQQLAAVISLLDQGSAGLPADTSEQSLSSHGHHHPHLHEDDAVVRPVDGRVVEGVFDGRGMVGSDGKCYLVPPNYASKSKLVEGDMLKLTITPKGSFIYKQIGPIDRSRLIGSLGYDQTTGDFYATSDNRRWNVLKASVTYFKGDPGDEVVLLVPKNAPSKWAAVENIIKHGPLD